ncbi:MAG: bifunctional riboflavin kinase/FAD synthetase [Chlorobiaceae bacterium]|nr:bifunctional riboflavin kinase/FAD synthetase [Chlorobiaceae bacterium]
MRILALHGQTVRDYRSGREEALPVVPSAVTVGSYDGLHVGHRKIIGAMVGRAREQGLRSVVVTFRPHPRLVLDTSSPCPVRLLTTLEEKIAHLESTGIDLLLVVRFDQEFARRSSESFIREVLVGLLGARRVVVGYDHGFGHDRSGSGATLQSLGAECGFGVDVVGKVLVGGEPVSSTRIRNLLLEAKVGEANACLGAPYPVSGTVVEGRKLGHRIGFPTVNLMPSNPCKLLPAKGVYLARTSIDGREWRAMMNIGTRPTVSDDELVTVEAHILGWSGDLYGRELHFSLLAFLREERRFDSLADLQSQLAVDKKRVELYPE